MVLRFGPLLLSAVLCVSLAAPAGFAQTRAGTEPAVKSGTLVEITKKGRVQALKYTDEAGEEQELILTPKIKGEVQAEGDAGFLREGTFIATIATESNEQLFATEVSVFLFGKGRVPGGKIVKAPPKPGQSQNAYQVSGQILVIGQDPDYPQYQRVAVKAAGPRAPLMLEEGFKVNVRSQDFSIVPTGTPIEFEGTELRGGRFNVTRVTAKLAEPLNSAEVLGSPEEKQDAKEKAVQEGGAAAESKPE